MPEQRWDCAAGSSRTRIDAVNRGEDELLLQLGAQQDVFDSLTATIQNHGGTERASERRRSVRQRGAEPKGMAGWASFHLLDFG